MFKKNKDNAMLSGVCAGLAEYLEIDVAIIRILFAVFTVIFPGSGLVVYFILWLLMPE